MEIPAPYLDESPVSYADRLASNYLLKYGQKQKSLGQFFTPQKISRFMAGKINPKEKIRILDPCAGTGILACAACEQAMAEKPKAEIELVLYEIDERLSKYLEASMAHLSAWMKKKGADFKFQIINKDFVLEASGKLAKETHECLEPEFQFDAIIANPPYFKVPKSHEYAKALSWAVCGQPNVYAFFMLLSASLLKKEGELVFITPRSFASGPYFRLFRQVFFSMASPDFIHVFGSRGDAFERYGILQENVIMRARKGSAGGKVKISFSNGVESLEDCKCISVPLESILDKGEKQCALGMPATEQELEIIRLVRSWRNRLMHYGVNISTGPVVPFRAASYLVKEANSNCVPLIWMQNVKPMKVSYPLKNHKKEAISRGEETERLLLPSKNYVLMRRFSAKEEKQRIVAAAFLPSDIPSSFVALENHLNYLDRKGGELTLEETLGFSAFYNCSLIDTYFRAFNGNTQVSATEIKNMPMPDKKVIAKIGRQILAGRSKKAGFDDWVREVLVNSGGVDINGKN